MILDKKNKIVNTAIAENLYKILIKINQNEKEVLYIMNDLENDIKRKKLIKFILNGNTNWDDISMESLKISEYVKFIPINMFENLDPNKKIYDYDELKLKPEYYN